MQQCLAPTVTTMTDQPNVYVLALIKHLSPRYTAFFYPILPNNDKFNIFLIHNINKSETKTIT